MPETVSSDGPTRCFFLELPLELRNKIYHELFCTAPDNPIDFLRYQDISARSNGLLNFSFLHTCKQICAEASLLAFKNLTIDASKLHSQEINSVVGAWAKTLRPESREAIKRIYLTVGELNAMKRKLWFRPEPMGLKLQEVFIVPGGYSIYSKVWGEPTWTDGHIRWFVRELALFVTETPSVRRVALLHRGKAERKIPLLYQCFDGLSVLGTRSAEGGGAGKGFYHGYEEDNRYVERSERNPQPCGMVYVGTQVGYLVKETTWKLRDERRRGTLVLEEVMKEWQEGKPRVVEIVIEEMGIGVGGKGVQPWSLI
ncbi:hypothetical protein F5884DRAFT_754882 [Xylogone sp. PMI_703]|nr:hypothetical protein F5884DRAFT_754882 [Xylogone sp. PMI_703]